MKLDDDLEDLRAALQKDHAASKRQAAGLPEAEESPSPEDESSSEESDGDSEVAEQSQAAPPKVDRNLLAQLLADDKGDSGKDKQQEEEPADAYDQAVKELTFERRVRPTDRLKTEDERIMEAAQALKEAEDARQRRMKGEPDAAVSASAPQGDDLDDGFDLAESGGDGFDLGQGLQEQEMEGGVFSLGGPLSDEDESGSDVESGEEEEDEDVESDFAAELEADEEMDGAFSGSDADQEHLVKPATSSRRTAAKTTTDQDGENIGFVFPCPTDHEEFLEVLESAQVADAKGLSTVIERIRTLHHPKLAPENNDKLSVSRHSHLRIAYFLSLIVAIDLPLCPSGSRSLFVERGINRESQQPHRTNPFVV